MTQMSFIEAAREAGRIKNFFRAVEKIEQVLTAAAAAEAAVVRFQQMSADEEKRLDGLKTATAEAAAQHETAMQRYAEDLAAAEAAATARKGELAAEIEQIAVERQEMDRELEAARAAHIQVLKGLAVERAAAEAEIGKIEAALAKLKNRVAAV